MLDEEAEERALSPEEEEEQTNAAQVLCSIYHSPEVHSREREVKKLSPNQPLSLHNTLPAIYSRPYLTSRRDRRSQAPRLRTPSPWATDGPSPFPVSPSTDGRGSTPIGDANRWRCPKPDCGQVFQTRDFLRLHIKEQGHSVQPQGPKPKPAPWPKAPPAPVKVHPMPHTVRPRGLKRPRAEEEADVDRGLSDTQAERRLDEAGLGGARNEGGWACAVEGCGVVLSTRQKLRNHAKEAHSRPGHLSPGKGSDSHHSPVRRATTPDRSLAARYGAVADTRWKCSSCDEGFSTRDFLRAHVREIHRSGLELNLDGSSMFSSVS